VTALALHAVASLVALASVRGEVGMRTEGRSSTVVVPNLPPDTRASYAAVPRAAVLADAWRLDLSGIYSPQIWANDVAARSSPYVNHVGELRLGSRREGEWSVDGSLLGVRARTDPLGDPVGTAAILAARATATAATTIQPVPYEELRAGLAGSIAVGRRDTVSAGGRWSITQGTNPAARELLPPQRAIGTDLALAHRATERDTLRLVTGATWTFTDRPDGTVDATWASALALWRRRLTPTLDAWGGAGAALSREDAPDAASEDLIPVGEAGILRAGEGLALSLEVAARVVPFVDRITGELDPFVEGSCAARWRASRSWAFAATASGGAVTDRETAIAQLDLRGIWMVGETLMFELGLLGRWQHEEDPALPSFREGGVLVAVQYATGPLWARSSASRARGTAGGREERQP
jgi:hypothetical protein